MPDYFLLNRFPVRGMTRRASESDFLEYCRSDSLTSLHMAPPRDGAVSINPTPTWQGGLLCPIPRFPGPAPPSQRNNLTGA